MQAGFFMFGGHQQISLSLHLLRRIRLTPLQPSWIDLQGDSQLGQDPGALGLLVFDFLDYRLLGVGQVTFMAKLSPA